MVNQEKVFKQGVFGMSREEIENHINFQLTLASIAYYNENHTKDISLDEAFEDGAEWMQKKMIEKACEWLYVYYPTFERTKSFEDAWEHFKKAMED